MTCTACLVLAHDEAAASSSAAALAIALAVVAVATLAGAWLGRRGRRRPAWVLAAASGALLAVAGLHVLPDAWQAAGEAGLPVVAVPLAVLAGYAVVGAVTRTCPCDPTWAGGVAAALAITLHRAVEGSVLAVALSVSVAAALAVHAAAEGVALGAIMGRGRRVWPWLALAVVSPLVGALVTEAAPVPTDVMPVLLGLVAGVLLRGAVVALRLSAPERPALRPLGVGAATAMGLALLVTGAAVFVQG